MEFIYVIGGNEPPYKVGRAGNTSRRLAEIQTGNPSPLTVVMSAETIYPAQHEQAVHSALAAHRLSGEWFSCDLGIVHAALKDVGLEPCLFVADHGSGWIEPCAFGRWLDQMRKPPFYASDAECARLLGVSANGILLMKKNGTDRRTALACRALLHRMEPYGSPSR